MSVISLSSEDEDDCVILDSDEEELYQHQIFIVESNIKVNVNRDDQLLLPELSSCIEAEQSFTNDKSLSETGGVDIVLKQLASKLAEVIENEKQVEKKILKEHNQNVISNIEKTILDVSKGFFSNYGSLKANHTKRSVWKRISKRCNKKKCKKWNSRCDLNTKLDLCSSSGSISAEIQNLKTNVVSKSNHNASKTATYGNKLKFTYDKLGAIYSVSVVSPTKTNETECESGEKTNSSSLNVANETSKKDSSERNTEQNLKHCSSENQSIGKNQKNVSVQIENAHISFSGIRNLKNTFNKHYSSVFDKKVDFICINMGFFLMTYIKETTKLQDLMNSAHKYMSEGANNQHSHGLLLEKDELKTSIRMCNDTIEQLKVRFIEEFSKIHKLINQNVIDTQIKIVFLTAWFMKMFLSITNESSDLEDLLHEAKIKTLNLLKADIFKWPLISKVFIKDELLFESDCLLVLDLIKNCLVGQSEQNKDVKDESKEKSIDQNINLESDSDPNQIMSVAVSKEFSHNNPAEDSTKEPDNSSISKLPEELQKLSKQKAIEVSVITSNLPESKFVKPNTSLQTVAAHSDLENKDESMNHDSRVHLSNCLISICHSIPREPLQIISLSGHPDNGTYSSESQRILPLKLSEVGIKSVTKESDSCLVRDSDENKLMPSCVSDEKDSSKGALSVCSKRKVFEDSCHQSNSAKRFSKSDSSTNVYKNNHLLQNDDLSNKDSESFMPCHQKKPPWEKAVFNQKSRLNIQSNLYFSDSLDRPMEINGTTTNNKTINVQQDFGFDQYQCYSSSKQSCHGLPIKNSSYNTKYENGNQACIHELSVASTKSKSTSKQQYLHCSQEGVIDTNSSLLNLTKQQLPSPNIGTSKISFSHLLNIETQGYSVIQELPSITLKNLVTGAH